jgi:hypothetical protein
MKSFGGGEKKFLSDGGYFGGLGGGKFFYVRIRGDKGGVNLILKDS